MIKNISSKNYPKVNSIILRKLNKGLSESNNFQEIFMVNFSTLFYSIAPFVSTNDLKLIKDIDSKGIVERMKFGAKILSKYFPFESLAPLKKHPSDTVRGWIAFVIGIKKKLSLPQKLNEIQALANDSHFAVREWSWLALRESITEDIHLSIRLLLPWALSEFPNIRRFSIESTRPRGVWSKHIPKLKNSPIIGLSLLNAVMEDSSPYVKKSCGNWLNDAAKSDPKWVIRFCQEWEKKSNHPSIPKITKRGLRNV